MRFQALIAMLAVGCSPGASDVDLPDDTDDTDDVGPVDTDTDPPDPEDVPAFDIVGEYTLGHGELLPEDVAAFGTWSDWIWSLSAEDFPSYEACLGEVNGADQGLVFEADGTVIRRFDLVTDPCPDDGTDAYHTVYVPYGSWAFASSAAPDAGDLYEINGSRTWRIYPLNAYYAVREGDVRFSLGPY